MLASCQRLVCIGILLASMSISARAEISQTQYEQMKRSAPEVLEIVVRKVEQSEADESTITYKITAEVRKVFRSAAGHKPNSDIVFQSYIVRPEAWKQGFVGPKSPPKLTTGWRGKVYLSDEFTASGLGPAAYSKSFERYR